jgi:hypothetical protein
MHRRGLFLSAFMFGIVAFAPAAAFAQGPTCAQLNTDPAYGLAGDPTVIAHSTTFVTTGVPYCQVNFTVSERGGPESGYAFGQIQRVVLRVGLPANTANGGTGGGAGLVPGTGRSGISAAAVWWVLSGR